MNKNESKYFNTSLMMDEALLEILEHKDYEFITVKEICLKAGVNRSTFYLHYESMDDLLNETLEMIYKKFYSKFQIKIQEDIRDGIQNKEKKELILINEKILTPYLNFILENKKLFLLLYKKYNVFKGKEKFDEWYNNIFIPIATLFGIEKSIQKYFIRYFIDGIISIIICWLENDCKEEVDKIIEIIYICTGIEKYLDKE